VRLDGRKTKKGLFMGSDERQQLISQYEAGYDEVLRNLAGFPPESLTAHPIPGKWSAAESSIIWLTARRPALCGCVACLLKIIR
jgi:hypothetical protein